MTKKITTTSKTLETITTKTTETTTTKRKISTLSTSSFPIKCSSFAGDWNGRHLEAVRAPAHLGKLEMSLGCGRESWIWATLVVSVEIFEDCPLVRALGAWGQLDQLPSREGQQRGYFSLKLTQRALSILRAGKIEIFLRIKRLSFFGGFEGWISLVLVALFISKMYNSFLAYICHLLI